MTVEQVLALINAGYTKDEITSMVSSSPAPAEPEPAEPTSEPATESTPEHAPAPEPEITKSFELLKSELEQLRKAIHSTNINTIASDENKDKTEEDVKNYLEGFIRPNYN